MKVRKVKQFYSQECTCPNCCQSEKEIREARNARKNRLLKVSVHRCMHTLWPNYKVRNFNRARHPLYCGVKQRPSASRVRRVDPLPRWMRVSAILKKFRRLDT